MKKSFLTLSLLISVLYSIACSGPRIIDPRGGNFDIGAAAFENVEIRISDLGAYAKVVLTFDLAAHTNYSSEFLEFEFPFQLPEGSILEESHLWMFGIKVKSGIYERNQAKQIYESFVQRRTDPLIIFKDGNSYEARIFPVQNGMSRKMEFSILVPVDIEDNYYQIPSLLNMFCQNVNSNQNIKILVEASQQLGEIVPPRGIKVATTKSDGSRYFELPLTHTEIWSNPYIKYLPKEHVDRFIVHQDSSGNGYFQLFLDDEHEKVEGRKLLVVMDVNYKYIGSTNLKRKYDLFQLNLLHTLRPEDSVKLLYHCEPSQNGGQKMRATNWFSANKNDLQSAFAKLNPGQTVRVGPLDVLTNYVIPAVNDESDDLIVLLMSLSDRIHSSNTSISEVADLKLKHMNKPCPLYVMEWFESVRFNWSDANLPNNAEFYSILAGETGGLYRNLLEFSRIDDWWWDYKVKNTGDELTKFVNACQPLKNFEELQYSYNGLLYDRIQVGRVNGYGKYVVVGRIYEGSGPLEVKYYYASNGALQLKKVTLQPEVSDNPLNVKIWAGNRLSYEIAMDHDKTNYHQIARKSIDYEVLTDYTAMLALEHDSMIANIGQQEEFLLPLSLEEVSGSLEFSIKAYPNPFAESLTIQFDGAEIISGSRWEVHVFDINGRKVAETKGSIEESFKGQISLNDVSAQLQEGTYFFKVTLNGITQTMRLVKM